MKVNKNTLFEMALLFIVAILGKIYQFTMLNGYAFGIINRMISLLHTNYIPLDMSYKLPLNFFRLFKFLPFSTAKEWAIFWTIIMNIVFFIFLLKYKKKYSNQELLFIYASMFILDVFVFNINKDLIQCLIVFMIFLLTNFKLSNKIKIMIAALIMFLESTCFRSYYIFGALTILIVFFVLNKYIIDKNINKKSVIKAISLILILLFVAIFIAQYINNKAYNELLSRRDTLAEDIDANTVIVDMIPGNGYINYCINYVINLLRLSFPVELLFMGIKYIPFVIYQIYLTINIIKNLKNINKINIFNISFIVGYWLMLFASESDFGTLVRHQAILFPFYLQMIDENIKRKKGVV